MKQEPTLESNRLRLAELTRRPWRMLVGGKMVDAHDGERYTTSSPATGQALAEVPFAQKHDVEAAVQAAESAYPAWRDTPLSQRVAVLRRFIAVLEEHESDLALLDAADLGSPFTSMRGDVRMACELLDYICNAATEVKGQNLPGTGGNWHITKREPYGVVGRIIPFNHPLMFAASKIGAPLTPSNECLPNKLKHFTDGLAPYPNSRHPQLCCFSFCDGSARAVNDNLDAAVYVQLVTPGATRMYSMPGFAPEAVHSQNTVD